MVGQVTDVTEQDVLALAVIIAQSAMIGLTVDVTKFLYNKFEPQGHVATTRNLISRLHFIFYVAS